jgi:hypothetical protein
MRLRVLAAALATALLGAVAPANAALPQVDYSLTGAIGDGDWFVGPVTVKWTTSGETTSDAGCLTRTLNTDTPGMRITCTAANGDGSVPATTKTIKIDQSPPTGVGALPARPPDAAPWYTAPVAVSWSGADATSGVATCTTLTYAGPDGPSVAPAGTCRDGAGNVSAPLPLALAYDATPPVITDLDAALARRTATVRWSAGGDAQQVTVVRTPGDAGAAARTVIDGPGTTREIADGPLTPGITYTWTVTVRDVAGNAASATTSPATPAKATTPRRPTLRWRARAGAKYYNLQLFRNGRKILSAWPAKPHYELKSAWRFRGHRHHLVAGRYRWFVWPGYGARSQRRYGRLLARGRVTVPRSERAPAAP